MPILTKAGSALKLWTLTNEDTGATVKGQFFTEIEMEARNNWKHHTALSRGRAITQFINSEVDRITFSSFFFALRESDTARVIADFDKLLGWSKPTQQLQRPPICSISVGDGYVYRACVIAGITNIKYGEPSSLGACKRVDFTVQLDAYHQFSIDENSSYETRYHRARERDYYEMLTWREYKNPMLGDVIRKRHPQQAQILPGDIIKLPSVEAIASDVVEPKSVALRTAFERKDTAQKALKTYWFNKRNDKYVSHVVK